MVFNRNLNKVIKLQWVIFVLFVFHLPAVAELSKDKLP